MSPRSDRPKRRSFTAKYKLDLLAEYDAAGPAERGVLLRREGLYSSHLSEWRKARDTGVLAGLSAPTSLPRSPVRPSMAQPDSSATSTDGGKRCSVRYLTDILR